MLTLEIALQEIGQLSPDQRNQVIQFIESLEFKANDSDETSTEEATEGITRGLEEALNGQTLPPLPNVEGVNAE